MTLQSPRGQIRLVMLQMRSVRDTFPECLPWIDHDHGSDTPQRSGVLLQGATERSSVAELLGELRATGYTLVSAFKQRRKGDGAPDSAYHIARFTLAAPGQAVPSRGVAENPELLWILLKSLCSKNLYSSIIYENQGHTENDRLLSVNLAARVPLFDNENKPIRVKQPGTKKSERPFLGPDFTVSLASLGLQRTEALAA